MQQGAHGADLLRIRQPVILDRFPDVPDQAKHGPDLILLLPAHLQQAVGVLALCSRLEAGHHAQPEIGQIVLAAAELMLDERGGMDVAVAVIAPLKLEHTGSECAAREITDACGAEVKHGQDSLQPAVQQRQRLEIRHRLANLQGPCRLRDPLEQGETVAVPVLRGGEKTVQQGAGVIDQMGVHEGDQIRLALMQPGTDQLGQGSGSGDQEAFLNEEVDTAVKHQPRLQVCPCHCGDLG